MSVVISTVIAAVSAFAAVASVLLYVYFGRRADLAAAREEALALAETRRQTIDDLRGRLEALEKRHKRAKEDCERRVRELQSALDKTRVQARNEAYQTQHFHAAALSGLLKDLRSDLKRKPPDVETALARIRKLLAGERPAA
jgi:molybdopterin converting factor small subunit